MIVFLDRLRHGARVTCLGVETPDNDFYKDNARDARMLVNNTCTIRECAIATLLRCLCNQNS